MNIVGFSVLTILGAILALSGIVGVVYYIVRYRKMRKRFEPGETENADAAPNTLATFWLLNGFLHIGMLLLTIGGIALIAFARR